MPTFHQLGSVRFPTDICLFSIRKPDHTAVTGVMDKCFQQKKPELSERKFWPMQQYGWKCAFTDGLLQAQERGEVQLLTLADIFE